MWREPLKWNEAAAKSGKTHRVFCSSLADVFEDLRELDLPRQWLWALIHATPHLTWLLLTKRPQNVLDMVPDEWMHGMGMWPHNVWVGTTVEDQRRADERIPHLLRIPAPVRFLSVEPQLERVDLLKWLPAGGARWQCSGCGAFAAAWANKWSNDCPNCGRVGSLTGSHAANGRHQPIQWVIDGGESGPRARPFDLDWARSLFAQCAEAGVPFFFKQYGENTVRLLESEIPPRGHHADPAWFTSDLRVQEFPEVRHG